MRRLRSEVPALESLKLVFQLELRAKGDTQLFRVELPVIDVSKQVAEDARLTIAMARQTFNELAESGHLAEARTAYEHGAIRVEGDPRIQQLIANVILKHQARAGRRRVR